MERQLRERARLLRQGMTDAERRLWMHLRDRRLAGYKFRRQVGLGRYIVDFLCREHGLVVELDGGQHLQQAAYDRQRDAWLAAQGLQVLRFWNDQVLLQTDDVLAEILRVLEARRPSPPAPLPQAGEGSDRAGG